MIDEQFNEDLVENVDEKLVLGYAMVRSIASYRQFTVVAFNSDNEALFVVESDLDFDTASKLVENLNNGKN